MDTLKLLGDLLGSHSMTRGGTAKNILEQILTGGDRVPEGPAPTQAPTSHPRTSPPSAPQPISQQTRPLTDWDSPPRSPAEVMRRGSAGQQNTLGGLIRQAVEAHGQRQSRTFPQPSARTSTNTREARDPQVSSQAEILIRAMINAAKSDGRVDEQEQQVILSKLGQLSQDEINFLRNEFAQPLDLQRFAQQVPRGLEVPVYTLSLTAIDLDTNREARYLHQLAQTLGLSPDTCNQIHAQLGAPALYR